MIRTFKFRYVNEIVGVFVLTVVGFVVAGIVIALRSKELFQPAQRITVDLPAEGSLGLKPGSTVFILGSDVGAVETINYKSGRMNAVITIRGQLIELVRDDTYAVISKSLGIGETYMTLERANPDWEKEPPLPANQHIPAISEAGATDRIQQVLTQVQAQIVPAMQEARAAIREYTALAADLRNPQMPLQQTISHLNQLTGSLEKGDSLAGRILTDKKFADQIDAMLPKVNASLDETQSLLKDLRKTSGNLADLTGSAKEDMKKLPELLDSMRATMDEMQAVMKDVRKSTARLPDVVDGANQTVQSLPGLVVQMQETMRQTQILIEGFQKSWLVRGNIDKSEPTGRIRPEEIGGGK